MVDDLEPGGFSPCPSAPPVIATLESKQTRAARPETNGPLAADTIRLRPAAAPLTD
jgi:hypothetical protein